MILVPFERKLFQVLTEITVSTLPLPLEAVTEYEAGRAVIKRQPTNVQRVRLNAAARQTNDKGVFVLCLARSSIESDSLYISRLPLTAQPASYSVTASTASSQCVQVQTFTTTFTAHALPPPAPFARFLDHARSTFLLCVSLPMRTLIV